MKDYTIRMAQATSERTVELRKHFSGNYSVADIDKHGNTSEEFFTSYSKAEGVYNGKVEPKWLAEFRNDYEKSKK